MQNYEKHVKLTNIYKTYCYKIRSKHFYVMLCTLCDYLRENTHVSIIVSMSVTTPLFIN